MSKKIIGISGVARSGKDTLAKLLASELESLGYSSQLIALASPLKEDLDDFCWSNFGISSFTQNSEEKLVIRDMLVAFGNGKRRLTQGKYFTNLADSVIEESEAEVCIVTDIRFDEYEEDELFWIKEKHQGKLVHVSRFDFAIIDETEDGEVVGFNERTFIQPANQTEAENDPRMKDAADYSFNWPTFDESYEQKCQPYVEKLVQWLIDTRTIELKTNGYE